MLRRCGVQIDKGTDVAMLSQYPTEAEVLFLPMTNLEVMAMPRLETMDGRSIRVLSIRVSLRNLTREEFQAKRNAVFMPSLSNVVQEIARDLDALIAQPPASATLLDCRFWAKETVLKDVRNAAAQYEAHDPTWFQVDQHYQAASCF